jgi:hypothetical protein
MARAKHKIDQMVQFTNNGTADHDVINSVISKKDGFYYGLSKQDEPIAESDIIAAYRPVVTRTRTAKKEKTAKASKKVAQAA